MARQATILTASAVTAVQTTMTHVVRLTPGTRSRHAQLGRGQRWQVPRREPGRGPLPRSKQEEHGDREQWPWLGQVQGRTADDATYWLAGAAPAWRDAIRVACIDMCTIYASAAYGFRNPLNQRR